MSSRRRYLAGRARALRHRSSPKVVIIGAGFGGLATAVALRRKGIDDLLIIERADGVGGTWRQNIYPGAACDIQSHLYSFSFAPNRGWTRTYAYQPEILAYLEKVADDFDLRRHLMLGTRVHRLVWDEQVSRWGVELADGRTIAADVVVSAVGLFGAVRYPDIEGLADFAGDLMHTAEWDASVDLTGKRVAVVGTGASGVQVVPELAATAAQLTVFQRTPPWMVPKEDRLYTVEELARFRRHPWAALRERWRLWKLQHDNTALTPGHPRLATVQKISENFLRRHVEDDSLREALTPHYPFRCKRVLLGEKYYTALQHAHVDLVTNPIDRITATSVITSRGAVDVDAIVLATGFETSNYLSGLEVIGIGGQRLHQRWGLDPRAYLGVAVSGFPNFFMLYGPNTNQGANSIIYILEAGARLVASAVSRLARRGGFIDVRPEAEQRFNEEVNSDLERTIWTQCDSYYRSPTGRIVTQWPYSELDYARATWRLRPRDWVHNGP
ncbi:cation diffusion facilitator CzcD-associated flavoprotein CzcO [Mycobacterium sp. OAS707]|uniref:flavin-containing monooxygenase n=1 Tax=Mycobacterium sp. OAS707 TaxID=2663822 RepID=UPI00178AECCE|nr:NAD(P)/FAD-dependent oxidoreductase [Mycobacterium sp. OAS707]MBE1548576.1 cation diffusion facilitator CzcD-associated flavoprotein CzcO [Mycobacterium sp. OAS707]